MRKGKLSGRRSMVKEAWDDGWDKWDSNDAESGSAGGKSTAAGAGEWDEDWGDGWDNDGWNDSKKPKATRRTPNPMVGIGGPPPSSFLSKLSPKVAMLCGGAVLVLVLIFTSLSFFSGHASTVKETSKDPAGTSGKEPVIDAYAEQNIPSDVEETEDSLGISGKESYTTAREAVRVSDLNSKKGVINSDPEEEETEIAAQEEPDVTLQEGETDETPEESEVSNEEPETTGLPLERASFNSVSGTGVDTEGEDAEAEVEDASSRSFGDPEEDPTVPSLTDSSEEDHFDAALNSVEADDSNSQAEEEEEEVQPAKARTSRSKVTSIPRYVEDTGEVHGEDVFAANLGEAQRSLPSTRTSSKIAGRDQVAGKTSYAEAEGDDEDLIGQRKIPAAKRRIDPDSSHVETEEMEIEPAGSIGKLASRARPRTSKVVKDDPTSSLRRYGENVWAEQEIESDTPARNTEDSSESASMIEPAGRLGSLLPAKRNGSRQSSRLSRLQVPSADSEDEHDEGHYKPVAKSISKRGTRGGTISSARSRVKSEMEQQSTDSFADTSSSLKSDDSIRPLSKAIEESVIEDTSDDMASSNIVLPTKVARTSVGTQREKRNSTVTVEGEDEVNVLPSQRLRGRRSGRLGVGASAAKTYPPKTLVAQSEAQEEEHDLEPLKVESKATVSRGKPSRARGTTVPQTKSVVLEEEAADPEDTSESNGDNFTEEEGEPAVSSPKARTNSLSRGKSKQGRTSVEDVEVDIKDPQAIDNEKTGSDAVEINTKNEAEIDEGSQEPVPTEKSSLLADETDAALVAHKDAADEDTADAGMLADKTDTALSTHEDAEDSVEEDTAEADHSTVGVAEGAEETSDSEELRQRNQVPAQDAEEADSEDAKDVKQEGSQRSGDVADSEEVAKDSVLDVSEEAKPADSEDAEVEHSDEADDETPEEKELQNPEETEPVPFQESESQNSIDEDSGNTDHLETTDSEAVEQETVPESEQTETETDSPNGTDADEQVEAPGAKEGLQASDSAEATEAEAEVEQEDTPATPEIDGSSGESDNGETDQVSVEDTASEKEELGSDENAISDIEEAKEGMKDGEASSVDTDGKPEEDEEHLNPDGEVAPEEDEAVGATPLEETAQSDGSVERESSGSESPLGAPSQEPSPAVFTSAAPLPASAGATLIEGAAITPVASAELGTMTAWELVSPDAAPASDVEVVHSTSDLPEADMGLVNTSSPVLAPEGTLFVDPGAPAPFPAAEEDNAVPPAPLEHAEDANTATEAGNQVEEATESVPPEQTDSAAPGEAPLPSPSKLYSAMATIDAAEIGSGELQTAGADVDGLTALSSEGAGAMPTELISQVEDVASPAEVAGGDSEPPSDLAGSSEQQLLESNSGNEEVPVGESGEERSPDNQDTTSDASKSSFKLASRKKSPFARAAPEADEGTAGTEATEMKASTKVRDRKAGSVSRSAVKEEGEAPASRTSRGASLRAERRAAWAKRRDSSHSTTH